MNVLGVPAICLSTRLHCLSSAEATLQSPLHMESTSGMSESPLLPCSLHLTPSPLRAFSSLAVPPSRPTKPENFRLSLPLSQLSSSFLVISFLKAFSKMMQENRLLVAKGVGGRGREGMGIWNEQRQTITYRMDRQQGPTV